MAKSTVNYYAISIFSSKTLWLNVFTFLVAALSLPDLTNIIPVRYMPVIAAVVAVANVYLRMVTVRPAALIAPGTTVPVEVPKIAPPPPPKVTT